MTNKVSRKLAEEVPPNSDNNKGGDPETKQVHKRVCNICRTYAYMSSHQIWGRAHVTRFNN